MPSKECLSPRVRPPTVGNRLIGLLQLFESFELIPVEWIPGRQTIPVSNALDARGFLIGPSPESGLDDVEDRGS